MKPLRAGLLLMAAFAVLAHGVVEVWSESFLEAGVALLFVYWAAQMFRDPAAKIYWSDLNWPLLGILAIGVAQLALHTTAYAFETRVTLLELCAIFIFFFLCVQAFRDRSSLTNLAWFLMLLSFGVSLLGLIQHFTWEGKIYWFRVVGANSDPFGPFVNRNHFAGFVELTLPVGFAMLVFRGIRRDVYPFAALLTIVPVSAMVLSGSRAGIIALIVQLAVFAVLVRLRKRKENPRMIGVAIVVLVAIAVVAWIGAARVVERFTNLQSSEVSLSRRLSMSRGAAHIFEDHPALGCGIGALIAVYPRYETMYDGKVVDHVHDDYMENLAETGIPGAICGLAFLFILFRGMRRGFEAEQGHFSRAIHAGAIVALCGLLLHSFVDFNLHIPSNMMLFLLQAHVATAPALPSEGPAVRQRRHRTHRYEMATEQVES
jgi:O-antigen ligase